MTRANVPAFQSLVGAHSTQAVSSTAVSLTPATNADAVLLQALDSDIRYTLDGTAPVGGTTGFLLFADEPPSLVTIGDNVTTLKVIRDKLSDAELQYQYVRFK